MSLGPGDVVWHEAPFTRSGANGGRPDRPWLVVSNDGHPFQGTEYVVLGMTASPCERGIRVDEADWTVGGTTDPCYVTPWHPTTVHRADVTHRIGTLRETLVDRAVDACTAILGFGLG